MVKLGTLESDCTCGADDPAECTCQFTDQEVDDEIISWFRKHDNEMLDPIESVSDDTIVRE